MSEIDEMVRAYLECALWADGDEFGSNDVSDDTRAAMREDCADFLGLLDRVGVDWRSAGISAEQLGQDFWLTRNRHGAGFWDRGWGDLGGTLTMWAHTYASVDLYQGDDGMVHHG